MRPRITSMYGSGSACGSCGVGLRGGGFFGDRVSSLASLARAWFVVVGLVVVGLTVAGFDVVGLGGFECGGR